MELTPDCSRGEEERRAQNRRARSRGGGVEARRGAQNRTEQLGPEEEKRDASGAGLSPDGSRGELRSAQRKGSRAEEEGRAEEEQDREPVGCRLGGRAKGTALTRGRSGRAQLRISWRARSWGRFFSGWLYRSVWESSQERNERLWLALLGVDLTCRRYCPRGIMWCCGCLGCGRRSA